MNLPNLIRIFFKGQERSVKAKKNIVFSLILKGISIIVGLVFVPLILGYLDAERYGIWLTLSSILAWFSFFDIGLGKGLRNRLAESIAKNDDDLGRIYVSTSYFFLGLVFLIVLILFFIINPYINWQNVLNTKIVEKKELSLITGIVFFFFVSGFFFKLIGEILTADQRPAINNLFGPLGNVIALIVIFILTKVTPGSLFLLSLTLSVSPFIVLVVATIYFFKTDYKKYIPKWKYVQIDKVKDLLSLGFKFFYLRIAVIIIYSSTNFLIAHFSNQQNVAAYNVAYKYLTLTYMVLTIILSPIWIAVTDSFVKNDFKWLKNTFSKINLLLFAFLFIEIILLVLSPFIYRLWIGNKIIISNIINILVAIYVILLMINATYSSFINGFGKLKMSLITVTFSLLFFVPLVYFLGKNYGVNGILIAMILVQLPSSIIQNIQVRKIINKKAKGIWNE